MNHIQVFRWHHFRFWLNLLRCEFKFWNASVGASVTFFGGDGDRDLQFSFGCWLFAVYLTLEDVMPREWIPKGHDCSREISIRYFERTIQFSIWDGDDWNSGQPWWQSFILHFPHDYDWVRTSTLLKNGDWVHETPGNHLELYDRKKWSDKLWKESHPYQYKLKSGKIQNITATVGVSEREWRWHWFKWSPFPRKISKTIDVDFSDEVGEETGSWKGGTVGCGYKMLPNETPFECLRRMERERKF